MAFVRRHGFLVAALAVVAVLLYWHSKCPRCQNSFKNIYGQGLRRLSGGQAVGESQQYGSAPSGAY